MDKKSEEYDYACGAYLGALIGDSIGSKLEFLGKLPSKQNVDEAMKMVGGGYWKVAPGQITDDGELTISLAKALVENEEFNLNAIALNYVKWLRSKPFDIGNTILDAFDVEQADENNLGKKIHKSNKKHNYNSKANGSLMRCVPIAIWGYNLTEKELAYFAFQDSRLSHPNISCCEAVACYVIAIASLIRSKGDVEYAFQRVLGWSNKNVKSEVKTWLEMIESNELGPFFPQAGFIKIAFINAFIHLKNRSKYSLAIKETISHGGDTDTNACIAGGLIGSINGVNGIDEYYIKILLSCDTSAGRERPVYYHPLDSYSLIEKLIRIAPKKKTSIFSKFYSQ
ncbi:MAG: hypothetical protein COA79_22035 [Planctomycetota bacterium]|nr:MAG: hypothetical protein COA79_22035 [Planctomycetota bacterium]